MTTIAQLIAANPSATDAEIAAMRNNTPDRYASAKVTFLELGDALVAAGITPDDAMALANRLMKDVALTSEAGNTALGAIFTGFASGATTIDFAKPIVRSELAKLPQTPGPFTAQDLIAIAGVLTDLHGGDTTEADVAAERERLAGKAETQRIIGILDARRNAAVAIAEAGGTEAEALAALGGG